jgi:hypothetical protein
MKIEDLEKANNLKYEIVFIKEQIELLKWTQSKTVVDRESLLSFNCTNDVKNSEIVVPKQLFKKVGQLVLTEYSALLLVKQLELNDLIK